MHKWKNLKKRLIFGQNIDNHKVKRFSGTQCSSHFVSAKQRQFKVYTATAFSEEDGFYNLYQAK